MESKALVPVTATLTKVLHRYGDLEVQETMRFANRSAAISFQRSMVNVRISNPACGSPYTIIDVSF